MALNGLYLSFTLSLSRACSCPLPHSRACSRSPLFLYLAPLFLEFDVFSPTIHQNSSLPTGEGGGFCFHATFIDVLALSLLLSPSIPLALSLSHTRQILADRSDQPVFVVCARERVL